MSPSLRSRQRHAPNESNETAERRIHARDRASSWIEGVIAEERAHELTVEFIERAFMKSAKAYKSDAVRFADDALVPAPRVGLGETDHQLPDLAAHRRAARSTRVRPTFS